MKVTRHTLFRERGQYASFPSLCRRKDGFLLAFRRAPDHRILQRGEAGFDEVDHLDARSHLALLALDRHGTPQGAPRILSPDVAACDQDPNLLRLRDGRIVLTGFSYYPLPASLAAPLAKDGALVMRLRETDIAYFFWGSFARVSDDDGATWTDHAFFPPDPSRVDVIPGVRRWHGSAVRGRAVELGDGTILQASYAGRPETGWCLNSDLWASTDRGHSWHPRTTIAADPTGRLAFCETNLLQLGDGSLLAFHRTAGADGRIATSSSRDGGASWDDAILHAVIGHPSDACVLADGRVLVVYGCRTAPFGVRARFWSHGAFEDEIVLADDVPSPDCGYPWVVPLDDGGALVAFYCADESGVRGIDAVVLSL